MIEEYLRWLEQKGYSPATLIGARSYLTRFSEWLWENFHCKVPNAREDHLERYVLYLKEGASLASGTQSLRLSAVRAFYKFCYKKDYLLRDITQNLPFMRRTPQILKDIPNESVITKLLEKPDTYTYAGIRDRAILELLYCTGLRGQELRDLKITDLDLREKTIKVQSGKGGRGRTLPLGKEASFWLQRYLEVTRPRYLRQPEENHLFLSSVTGKALQKTAFLQIIVRYRQASGLTKQISAHTFRHACALHMLRNGAPIEAIQELLGHRRLSTTQIYTKLNPQDLKTMLKKHHPREKSYGISRV